MHEVVTALTVHLTIDVQNLKSNDIHGKITQF